MPESSRPKIVLAFDFGLRRIGVACGDTVSRRASPLETVPAGPNGPRWELIGSMLRDWQPDMAVVGLPYNVDGSDSEMTLAARGFAAELARRFGLEVAMVDERYSSLEAGERHFGLPPRHRDFHRQNERKPARCHRITVSGFTNTKAFPTRGAIR